MKKKLSKLKSRQYPLWITQKTQEMDLRVLKSKKVRKGERALTPPPPS